MVLEPELLQSYENLFANVEAISYRVRNLLREMGGEDYEMEYVLKMYKRRFPGHSVSNIELNSAMNILGARDIIERERKDGKNYVSLKG